MKLSVILLLIVAMTVVNCQESRRRSRVFRNYYQWRRNSTTTLAPSFTTNPDAEEITEPTPSLISNNKFGESELIDSCNREPGCQWECNDNGQEQPSCTCLCKRPTSGRRGGRRSEFLA